MAPVPFLCFFQKILYMKKLSFLKQKNMVRVLYSLVPIFIASIYYFGWRSAVILAVSVTFALATEWIMAQRKNGRVSYACFVTASLYALSLPPTTPFWIVATGVIIAILFGKEAFGGFGKNIFNPAIVGRAFVYVAFPIELTARFVPALKGFPGGFAKWSFESMSTAPQELAATGISVPDAISAATPMWSNRDFGFTADVLNLFLGNIGTTFEYAGQTMALAAGSLGEVSAVLIILSGIYLIWTKTAQWRLTAATLLGALFATIILRYVLGIQNVPPPLFTMFSGALMYGAVFMVTDPVSAPKVKLSHWIYGIFIGIMVVFFRFNSIFAGGVAFSILLGNMLAPSLDLWIKRYQQRKKKAA